MEGGADALLVGGGGGTGCTAPLRKYTAMRFGYAKHGQAVTFVHDESWCWNGVDACEVGGSYQIAWAREFRYDGARARYMNRALSPGSRMSGILEDIGTVWSDYDDEAYGDYRVTPGSPPTIEALNQYQPGLWRQLGYYEGYLHNDALGTLRLTTSSTGDEDSLRVFTAFGERITTTTDRFGYVGAWGYQSTPIPESLTPDPFPFLHVGARYYDPSSGRFLQRDPIGIFGGWNVFTYASNIPSGAVDASGLSIGIIPGPQKKPWDPMDPQRRLRPSNRMSRGLQPARTIVAEKLIKLDRLRPVHQPSSPATKPAPPVALPPQGIMDTPAGLMAEAEHKLILIGIALPVAILGDLFLTLSGVPLWYEGNGSQFMYCTQKVWGEVRGH